MLSARDVPFVPLLLLWAAGLCLRITVLAVPPLATDMAATFGLGEAGTGALTMLPLLAIALGSIPAAWLIARSSVRAAIVVGLTVAAFASVGRGVAPGAVLLFTASIVMGLGIAAFQTALPSATKAWTPVHVGLGSAVFLNGMMVGEFTSAGLTLPMVLPVAEGLAAILPSIEPWVVALGLWSAPLVVVAIVVALAPLNGASDTAPEDNRSCLPRWDDAQVWQFGLLLAGSIVAFYAVNAYAGSLLTARREQDGLPSLLFAFNLTPLAASFAVLARPRWIGQRGPLLTSATFAALGLAGFVLLDGPVSWVAATIAGFASTVELILLVSLPAAIASGAGVARMTAGMTLIGYTFAFVLPLVGGALADATARTDIALVPPLVFAIATLALVGRRRIYTCRCIVPTPA